MADLMIADIILLALIAWAAIGVLLAMPPLDDDEF